MGTFVARHPVLAMSLAVAAAITSTALAGRVMWPLELIVSALAAIVLVGLVTAAPRHPR